MCVKLDVTPVRLDSDLSTALYKSFTYLFTYLLTVFTVYSVYIVLCGFNSKSNTDALLLVV